MYLRTAEAGTLYIVKDYTEGVCLTAEGHRIELAKQLKYTLSVLTPEEIAENDYIMKNMAGFCKSLTAITLAANY